MFEGSLSQIHAVSRAQLLDDAFDFAQTNQLSYATFLNLTRFLAKDIDYVPWAAANAGLTYLDRMFAGHANHHVFRVKIFFFYFCIGFSVGIFRATATGQLIAE